MKWKQCIAHRGARTNEFVTDYFSDRNRRVLVVAGAGFDPRSVHIPKLLAAASPGRLDGVFIREERPNPSDRLAEAATLNETKLRELVPDNSVEHCQIINADDGAVIGGREIAKFLKRNLTLDKYTDIVLDCSALSVCVFYSAAAYFHLESASRASLNFHVFVHDDPDTDAAIRSELCDAPSIIHPFHGQLKNDAKASAARLWIPQFGKDQHPALQRIFGTLMSQHELSAVCPVLPFPARYPRYVDELVENYIHEIQETWEVDSRDFVYAEECNPVDLYRSILTIDDARKEVFGDIRGSHIVLSPLGSKALSIGMLMACLDREFSAFSVEALGYDADDAILGTLEEERGEMIHIWLSGEAYA